MYTGAMSHPIGHYYQEQTAAGGAHSTAAATMNNCCSGGSETLSKSRIQIRIKVKKETVSIKTISDKVKKRSEIEANLQTDSMEIKRKDSLIEVEVKAMEEGEKT